MYSRHLQQQVHGTAWDLGWGLCAYLLPPSFMRWASNPSKGAEISKDFRIKA